jgi:hypothetical protein
MERPTPISFRTYMITVALTTARSLSGIKALTKGMFHFLRVFDLEK